MEAAGPCRNKAWPMLLGWKGLAVVCQEPGEQVLGAATLTGNRASVPLAGLAEWVASSMGVGWRRGATLAGMHKGQTFFPQHGIVSFSS